MGIKKLALFLGGVLFGTAGIKVLASKDAKNVYAHTVAAALRAKEGIMTAATSIKEQADDILAQAEDINEKRISDAKADAIIENTAPAK